MGKFKVMQLETWLESTGRTPASFARDLGVEASTIHRLVRQARKPSYELMEKIAVATDGAVRPDDFFPGLDPQPASPEPAPGAPREAAAEKAA